jgi:multiple sugar transport system substrate-binding protein
MRKTTKVVAIGLGLTMILTGCAPASPDGSGSTEAVSLTWMTRPDNQAEANVYASISDDITAKGIGLDLTYVAGSSEGSPYQDKLKTDIAAGTAPDVFWLPGTDIADFAKAGLILNIRGEAAKTSHSDADFYAGPMASLTVDPATGATSPDYLWGIPRDVSTFAMYMNLDLIEKAGVEDPRELAAAGKWDWAAFEATSKAITEKGGAGVKGFGANGWWANWGYFVHSAGGGFFNEDRTACALNSDKSVAGLNYLKGLYDNGYGVAFGEDAEPPFKAGQVGMFINGRWATPGAREITDFAWDVVALPTGASEGRNWQFWGAYVVNAKTANPAAAWKLIQELTSAEVQGKISELGANIPSRVSAEATAKFLTFSPPANNQAFLDGIANNPVAEGPLWNGNWPAFDKAAGDGVTALLSGSRTLADFQANICTEAAGAFN